MCTIVQGDDVCTIIQGGGVCTIVQGAGVCTIVQGGGVCSYFCMALNVKEGRVILAHGSEGLCRP